MNIIGVITQSLNCACFFITGVIDKAKIHGDFKVEGAITRSSLRVSLLEIIIISLSEDSLFDLRVWGLVCLSTNFGELLAWHFALLFCWSLGYRRIRIRFFPIDFFAITWIKNMSLKGTRALLGFIQFRGIYACNYVPDGPLNASLALILFCRRTIVSFRSGISIFLPLINFCISPSSCLHLSFVLANSCSDRLISSCSLVLVWLKDYLTAF